MKRITFSFLCALLLQTTLLFAANGSVRVSCELYNQQTKKAKWTHYSTGSEKTNYVGDLFTVISERNDDDEMKKVEIIILPQSPHMKINGKHFRKDKPKVFIELPENPSTHDILVNTQQFGATMKLYQKNDGSNCSMTSIQHSKDSLELTINGVKHTWTCMFVSSPKDIPKKTYSDSIAKDGQKKKRRKKSSTKH